MVAFELREQHAAQKSRLLSDWLYVKHRSVVTEKKKTLGKDEVILSEKSSKM